MMKCLHGKPAAHSTTQKGSFWFRNQSLSCHFFCSEDEEYLFEKAVESWKSTKQPRVRTRCTYSVPTLCVHCAYGDVMIQCYKYGLFIEKWHSVFTVLGKKY